MGTKGRITKKERKLLFRIILGVIAFSLLSPGIRLILERLIPSETWRFIIGLAFFSWLAYEGLLD